MNRYDEYFDFRIADEEDIDGIMEFIRENWDPRHILGNDRDFFRYHYGGSDGKINVFLMLEKKGRIAGMLGFVEYSDVLPRYVSGSITKVRNKLPLPMCGVELIRRFHQHVAPFVELSCGTNPKTILPVFKDVFKYQTGRMEQFCFLNSGMKEYRIITVPRKWEESFPEDAGSRDTEPFSLEKADGMEDVGFDFGRRYEHLPVKSRDFIEKRYFCHPVFHYDVYNVRKGDACRGLLFMRKIPYKGSSIILIVDFLGDTECLGHLRDALRGILMGEGSECFSLLVANFPREILKASGFRSLEEERGVIVPTYFEPFVNQNIENYFITSEEGMILFKATGDQDNPKYGNREMRKE